jgi:hypothetical protein
MRDNTRFPYTDELSGETEELRELILESFCERRIEISREEWNRTGDPMMVWEAIAVSAEQERPLPEWVVDYLGTCAKRMTTVSGDVRKALPEVLGLAGRRGPRNRLDNEKSAGRFVFSGLFFYWIMSGDSLEQALAEARTVLHREDASADDLTLLRWLAKEHGLSAPPRSLDGWRKAFVFKECQGIVDSLT